MRNYFCTNCCHLLTHGNVTVLAVLYYSWLVVYNVHGSWQGQQGEQQGVGEGG